MGHCVVIARNGYGDVWLFPDVKSARLHPIPQMDDVIASGPEHLVEQYGPGLIDDLLRFAEGRERARLVDAFENWRSVSFLSPEAQQLVWEKVTEAGATPPIDPAEIVRIIQEDRLFREGRVLRSIGKDERSSSNPKSRRTTEMSEETATAPRKRINENATIRILTEGNPKRQGSKAADRFPLYQDGMTVKEAKTAGVQATDIAYDLAHNFIELTDPDPVEQTEATEEGEAPKSRKRSRAAA